MSILVFNAGSTSLKFGLFDPRAERSLLAGDIDWADGNRQQARLRVKRGSEVLADRRISVPDYPTAVSSVIAWARKYHEVKVIGHRVVQGGIDSQTSRLIDEEVKAGIARLGALAPLHNPPALQVICAAEILLPGLPQVAVFDTAFFARLPESGRYYPIPFEWHARWGIRRFGFHGISNAYCASRAAELLNRPRENLRLITCHLGGGCSATAVRGGIPVATTMGFTPLDGLFMGSRAGSLDPGLLLHLQRHGGLSVDDLDHALNHESGLKGISGLSSDLAEIEAAAQRGHERARLAFDMFAGRVRTAIGGLAVNLGGLDVLVFTDRIGENSPALRAAACEGLVCLGAKLDAGANACCQPDADIATPDSAARILVIRTQEELMIARETICKLASSGQAS